ncbi:MAG: hypothetical protein J5I50_08410 [Chitinophagaceae bacterium]|nr:hypothetical protein [Chitinophagaceae bacterium]
MKSSNLIYLLLGFFFLLNQNGLKAQALPCGTHKIDTTALRRFVEYKNTNAGNRRGISTVTRAVRVYFHILRYDDGTNPVASLAEVVGEYNQLPATYSADNLCFINCGINYVNNSSLDSNFNGVTGDFNSFAPYIVPGCVNVFYVTKIKGNNPACSGNCGFGGIASSIPGNVCLISRGNIGKGQTTAHEVGHCLGLLHTFESFNGTKFENIDGTNSDELGDYVSDTPADPYAYVGQSCFSTTSNGCIYTGTCMDPKGATNFTPPYFNLMSYWWAGGCYSNLILTSGQFYTTNYFMDSPDYLLDFVSPANVTIGPNYSQNTGTYMMSAVNTLATSDSVVLSGNIVSVLAGTKVILKPGFTASPSPGTAEIKIIPLPCN